MKYILALLFSVLSFGKNLSNTPSTPGVSDNNISDEQTCIPCILKKMGLSGGGGNAILNQDSVSKQDLLESGGEQKGLPKGGSNINSGNGSAKRNPAGK